MFLGAAVSGLATNGYHALLKTEQNCLFPLFQAIFKIRECRPYYTPLQHRLKGFYQSESTDLIKLLAYVFNQIAASLGTSIFWHLQLETGS